MAQQHGQPTVWVPYHILVEATRQLENAHRKWGPYTALKPKMQAEGGVIGVYEERDPNQLELELVGGK